MAIGRVVAEHMVGGNERHSWLQTALGAYVYKRRHAWGIHVYSSQRIRVRPKKCLSADLCVVSRQVPAKLVIDVPPLLVIEIVVLEDIFFRFNEKISEWRDFGLPCIWAVDAETLECQVDHAHSRTFPKDGVLRIPGTPIEVPLHSLDED